MASGESNHQTGEPAQLPLRQAPIMAQSPPLEPGRADGQSQKRSRALLRAKPLPEPPPSAAPPLGLGRDTSTATIGLRRGLLAGAAQLRTLVARRSPPWLISAAFHMTLLIVLALLMVALPSRREILLSMETAEQLGDQLEFDSPLANDADELDEPIVTLENLPEVDDPFAAPASLELFPGGHTPSGQFEPSQIGLALDGREAGSRESLLGRYGGTAATEEAVLAGLEWLARNQRKTGPEAGSWSLAGPFGGGLIRRFDNPVSATAMALLAFQGAGNTHRKGRFRSNVAAGWKWLLLQQDSRGNFFHAGPYNHRFYTQGQCTIAVCELYGMSGDSLYIRPAELAVQYCLRTQGSEGGWKYSPNARSDLSVTGWVLMGLQSARMAKLEVPEENLRRVGKFLDSVAAEGGQFRYEPNRRPSLAMTAEGLLCRQYLGCARDDPQLVAGVEWITDPDNLVDFDRNRDVYSWYYATQVAHHMEGQYWERWNRVMRKVLPQQQVRRGVERGSWDPQRPTMDQWAPHGGRLYVTCLSIYMLEVYYRHLPIYTSVYAR